MTRALGFGRGDKGARVRLTWAYMGLCGVRWAYAGPLGLGLPVRAIRVRGGGGKGGGGAARRSARGHHRRRHSPEVSRARAFAQVHMR